MFDENDERFANTLLGMARTDAEAAFAQPDNNTKRAVTLWMCEELIRQASRLKISRELATKMRETGQNIRKMILDRPAPASHRRLIPIKMQGSIAA